MSGFVKRTFPIFQCISSLNIIYARIHNSCTVEIRRPDFNDDSNYAQSCPNALASSEYNIYIAAHTHSLIEIMAISKLRNWYNQYNDISIKKFQMTPFNIIKYIRILMIKVKHLVRYFYDMLFRKE